MKDKCFFVSDLHRFAQRSQASRYESGLAQTFSTADTFVLGGDVFDFRWSTLESHQKSINSAVHWLERLIDSNPKCQVNYVLGNHDCCPLFVQRLNQMAQAHSEFSVHPYFYRRGSTLFLHGEPADQINDQKQLEQRREKFMEHERKGRWASHVYDHALNVRLHKLVNLVVHRDQAVAKRLIFYLDSIGQGPDSGVENVYFGHTHRAMNGFELDGIKFYNGGAPMKGLHFDILRFGDAA